MKLEELEELKKKHDELAAELVAIDKQIQNYKPEIWEPGGGKFFISHQSILGARGDSDKIAGSGDYFETKEQAEKELRNRWLNQRIAAFVRQEAPDYEPDLDNINIGKYFINYDYVKGKYRKNFNTYIQQIGVVYMPEHVADKLLGMIKSGEFITDYDEYMELKK